MKQENNLNPILDKISSIIPILMAFFVPIFFLPNTSEFFSFNKIALVTVFSLILLIINIIKVLTNKEMSFVKSSMDMPLAVFTFVMILSTVFSLNKDISIFGGQGRWLGLFSWISLLSYYYLTNSLLKGSRVLKTALYAFVASSTISAIVSTLSYFKIFLGNSPFVQIQSFSLTGSITDASIISAIALVIGAYLISQEKLFPIKLTLIGSTVLNFFFIALTNTLSGWAVLVLGLVGIMIFGRVEEIVKDKVSYLILLGSLTAISILFVLPMTRSLLVDSNFGKELRLPVRESWIVSSSIIQDYPVLATGPSTFSINFTRYRPLSLNASETWNVSFDKPFNEVFNVLSTLGLIGFASLSLLGVRSFNFIGSLKKIKDETGISNVLGIALFASSGAFLFTYASILTLFVWFMLLSMLVASYASVAPIMAQTVTFGKSNASYITSMDNSVVGKEYLRYIISVLGLVAISYIGYISYNVYAAEVFMRKSIVAATNNDGTKTYEYQAKAINHNPRNSVYHIAYAQTNLALANSIAAKENLTDKDRETIQTLISQAIRTSRIATEVVNPLSAGNWETRALIYRSITNVAQNASDWSISSYNTAIQLDPTNPRLRLDLGGLYYAKGDFLSAANQFRQATALKPDYANAYFNFANALIQLKDYQGAKSALEVAKNLVDENSEDYKLLVAQLEEVEKQISAQGTANTENKPTVEQLTGVDNQQVTQTQEPLTNVAEQSQIQNQNLDLGTLPKPENKQNDQNN